MLADAVALADEEGAGDAEGEEHGTDLVGEAADQGLGLAAGALALLVHNAAQGLGDVVIAAAAGPGSFASPGGSGGHDDVGPQGLEVFVSEAEALHDAGTEVLGHDVEGGDDAAHHIDRARNLEIEGDALLAPVVTLEVGREAVGLEAARPAGLAAGRLDLDDLGAHVAEEEGREGPLLVLGEVEHAHAVQGGGSLRRTGGIGVL